MKVRMDLYDKLPEAWLEYVAHNPQVKVVSGEPGVIRLDDPDHLSGLVTALGRLKVPARALYIDHTA